jgi:hypothetical protein
MSFSATEYSTTRRQAQAVSGMMATRPFKPVSLNVTTQIFDQAAFARDSSFFPSSLTDKFAGPSMTVSFAASADFLGSPSKIAAKRIIPTIGKATEITATFILW